MGARLWRPRRCRGTPSGRRWCRWDRRRGTARAESPAPAAAEWRRRDPFLEYPRSVCLRIPGAVRTASPVRTCSCNCPRDPGRPTGSAAACTILRPAPSAAEPLVVDAADGTCTGTSAAGLREPCAASATDIADVIAAPSTKKSLEHSSLSCVVSPSAALPAATCPTRPGLYYLFALTYRPISSACSMMWPFIAASRSALFAIFAPVSFVSSA